MQHSGSTTLSIKIVILKMLLLLAQCGVKLPPKPQHEQSGPHDHLRQSSNRASEEPKQ